jgi:hypothetical protein
MGARSFIAATLTILGLSLFALWYSDSTREHRLLIAAG